MDRLTELAYAAWLNAQLHDDVAQLQGLPEAATRKASTPTATRCCGR